MDESFQVSVQGGVLHARQWGSSGPIVLASHGITANHTEFHALADQLGDGVRVVAPDHRGRGRSREITGPWGMEAHADDLVAVLDHLEAERCRLLLGHSMGGFVAVVAAARHPERFDRVLLVDGGLPLVDELPEGTTTEALTEAVIGPAMERLAMTFESVEAYLDYWRSHPAFASEWNAYVEEYLTYDLVGAPPRLRPSARRKAVVADTESQLVSDLVPRSLAALRVPLRMLLAPRGLLDGPPLYDHDRIAMWAPRVGVELTTTTVDDVNHYTIMISERGAAMVADEVRALLA